MNVFVFVGGIGLFIENKNTKLALNDPYVISVFTFMVFLVRFEVQNEYLDPSYFFIIYRSPLSIRIKILTRKSYLELLRKMIH